jgi:hypothetical protein
MQRERTGAIILLTDRGRSGRNVKGGAFDDGGRRTVEIRKSTKKASLEAAPGERIFGLSRLTGTAKLLCEILLALERAT